MEKEKVNTFINRQEKKSPNSRGAGRGVEGWEGEEAAGRKAAEWPGRAGGRGEMPGKHTRQGAMPREHGARYGRNRGSSMPKGAELQSRAGAGCTTAASARAGLPTAGLPTLQLLQYLLLK